MTSNYKRLGDFIEFYNIRAIELDKNLDIESIRGISSISKSFIKTKANLVGVVADKYKVVTKNCFAYNPNTARMGDRIPIALNTTSEIVLVSSIYPTFKIVKTNELVPEYLMMWFKRCEFDRYARNKSHGSAREVFDIEEMNELVMPIPSIEKQQELVREYNTIQNRIALNNQLISKLEETAQAIYKQWFVDFEFPDENGKPYKSNGGNMVWCEELEKEIPEGWEVGTIDDLFTFQRGHDLPSQDRVFGIYPIYASTGISEYHNEFKSDKPTIITGRSGTLGELFYVHEACWPLNTTLYIKSFKNAKPFYAFYFLKTVNLKEMGAGSAVPTLNRNDIHALKKEIPSKYVINLFEDKISKIFFLSKTYKLQNQKLEELKELLLGRMVRVEN